MPLSDDDDDDHVQVTPRRRVPLTAANQDDSDLVVKGISSYIVLHTHTTKSFTMYLFSVCEILFSLKYKHKCVHVILCTVVDP